MLLLPKFQFIKAFITFLLILCSLSSSIGHPFYLGITTIAHKKQEKTIQISISLFHDDLEQALNKYSSKKLHILSKIDKTALDLAIAAYVQENLKVQLEKKAAKMQYLGYQIDGEAAWIYFEIPQVSKIKNITVYNSLLTREFKEQGNIVHVESNGKKQSTRLTANKVTAFFSF